MTTAEILAEWKALCDAATEGPWECIKKNTSCGYVWTIGPFHACIYRDTGGACNENVPHEELKSNANLIAAAPTAMPRLIAALEHALKGLDDAGRIDVHEILSGGTDE